MILIRSQVGALGNYRKRKQPLRLHLTTGTCPPSCRPLGASLFKFSLFFSTISLLSFDAGECMLKDSQDAWSVRESGNGKYQAQRELNSLSFAPAAGTDMKISIDTQRQQQVILLAQEEAKCLQKYGSLEVQHPATSTPSPILPEEAYNPFQCINGSKTFTHCETCRSLTSQIRTQGQCSEFCKSDKHCLDLCVAINFAVNDSLNLTDRSNKNTTRAKENERSGINHENNPDATRQLNIHTHSLFAGNPQVFCEGVVEVQNRSNNTKNAKLLSNEDNTEAERRNSDNVTNHFIVLNWNLRRKEGKEPLSEDSQPKHSDSWVQVPIVFVIEKFSSSSKKWETLGKTTQNLQAINVRYFSDSYKWRVTAVGPSGILDQTTSNEYATLNGYVKPGPPKKVYVVKQLPVNSSVVNVLIGWDPPDDNACFYRIRLSDDLGIHKSGRVKEPIGVHRHWFSLLAGEKYNVLVTARDPTWDISSESSFTRLDIKTPTCLESFGNSFQICVPPPPQALECKIQDVSENGKTMGVLVTWKPPQNASEANPILNYTVTISKSLFSKGGGVRVAGTRNDVRVKEKQLNFSEAIPYMIGNPTFSMSLSAPANTTSNTTTVAGNVTQIYFPALDANAEYQIIVRAVSFRGASSPTQNHLFLKASSLGGSPTAPLSNWIYLAIPICIITLIILACNMGRMYLQRRKVKIARNQYFQSMDERDGEDWSIVPLTEDTSTWKLFDDNFPKDKWEIGHESLIMGEVIGQGAFGVVRRAKIHRKKLQLSTLKYLDKGNTRQEEDKNEELETVAVKMLKVSATREDREQLVKEIMTMQSLGFHPQIVGLIGACTRGRSLSLVLEFCPGGDLLTFIRKVRAKYWPTLGLAESKRSTPTSSISRDMTGSGSFRGARRISFNPNEINESEDNSTINYADLDHSSAYSSSRNSFDQGVKGFESSDTTCLPNQSVGSPQRSTQEDEDDDNFHPIDERDVLSYARQIAMGMEYLEKNRIVHRDLACRNCLLMGDRKQVKLSDFGLSRDIYTWNVYHQKSNGKLPIKWMAIESIFTHVFTTKSDVWSFGITLWELVTLGGTPYPGLGNTELFQLMKTGYRMERPDNCSEELYALMKKCWRTSPAARPNFTELRNHIQNMMEANEPNLYLSLMADIPADYFRLSSRSDLLHMKGAMDSSSDMHADSSLARHHYKRRAKSGSGSGSNSKVVTSPSSSSTGEPSLSKSISDANKRNIYSDQGTFPTDQPHKNSQMREVAKSHSNSSFHGERRDPLTIAKGKVDSGSASANSVSLSPGSICADTDQDQQDTFPIKQNRISKSVSASFKSAEGLTSLSPMRKSPTSPSFNPHASSSIVTPTSLQQFGFPFRQVNNMTIIENRTYDIMD